MAWNPKNPLPFPYPLPAANPSWLTSTAAGIISSILALGEWDSLPILADALQDAGCEDAQILDHLRHHPHESGVFPNRTGGCWEGTCWVVRLLLRKEQRVLARYLHAGDMDGDAHYAPVLNPGSDVPHHRVWIVVPHTWAGGPEYAVEALGPGDAEDEFVDDDDFGKDHRIAAEDLMDYITDGGSWGGPDGSGEVRPPEYDCHWTGSGHPYDTEDIHVYGVDAMGYSVLYRGPGLPPEGVSPLLYATARYECVICGKSFVLSGGSEQVCSPACAAENDKILEEVDEDDVPKTG